MLCSVATPPVRLYEYYRGTAYTRRHAQCVSAYIEYRVQRKVKRSILAPARGHAPQVLRKCCHKHYLEALSPLCT
eukprot:COSAG01_NODE_3926_length_5528_cov_26.315344_6_plen_75_part_00